MKCPHCGTENRPEVRFCRGCGRPLGTVPPAASSEGQPSPAPAAPVSAAPSGRSCPHCGSAIKPQARFCPRCGEALTPTGAEPAPAPAKQPTPSAAPQSQQPPQQPPAQAPPATPAQPPQEQPRYAQPQQQPPPSGKTQPQSPGGAQREAYAQPQAAAPPPSGPPSTPSTGAQSGFPTWLWIVIGVVVGLLLLIVAFLGLRLLSKDDETDPTATPTPSATQEVAAPTNTTEPVVAADPTEAQVVSPTLTSGPALTETTATPEAEEEEEEEEEEEGTGYESMLVLGQPPDELKVGDSWTMTATVENTGDVNFKIVDYNLLGNWVDLLDLTSEPPINPAPIPPQGSRTVEFVFDVVQEGQAEIRLLVTVLVLEMPPSKELIEAEPIQVTIVP
jgi:hypothetical protein